MEQEQQDAAFVPEEQQVMTNHSGHQETSPQTQVMVRERREHQRQIEVFQEARGRALADDMWSPQPFTVLALRCC